MTKERQGEKMTLEPPDDIQDWTDEEKYPVIKFNKKEKDALQSYEERF